MGGLFKKPKAPPPDPKIEENLREQELAAEQERVETGKKIASRAAARRRGGRKGLMAEGVTVGTAGRETQQLQSTLGRNPRSG
jgi:hypothetical protein